MKRKKTTIILIFIVFFTFIWIRVSLNANSDHYDNNYEKIFEQYISVCGGAELSKIKTEKRIGTLIKGKTGKVPFTSISTSSGKWFYNQVFAFGDQVCYGFDGHVAWVADKDSIAKIPDREVLDLKVLFDIRLPLGLRQLFPDINLKEIIKADDTEHLVFFGRTENNIQLELVFDKQSALLLRLGNIYFSDYKKIGRVVRPHKIFLGHDKGQHDLRLMMEIAKISFNESVDDKVFSQPLCPLKPTRAPLYTRRKQISVSNEVLEALVGEYQQVNKPENVFVIKRQDNHLMMKTSRSPYFIELKPETQLDYFVRFLNLEVHFVKNNQGQVVCLEIGPERKLVAEKINPE